MSDSLRGPIVVYGATGVTGRLCVEALEAGELPYVVAGRREAALREVAGRGCVDVLVADADALGPGLEKVGAGALLSAAGPFLRFGEAVLDGAIAAGVPYCDTTAEQAFVALALRRDAAAREADLAVLPACGVEYLPMLLGAALLGPGPVDSWLWLDDFLPTPGSVRSMVAMAGRGRSPRPRRYETEDRVGWDVAFPGVEQVLVHPDSRTHLMLGRWEALPFALLWPLARRLPLDRLGDAIARRVPVPEPEARAADRFTVVVSRGQDAVRMDGGDVYRSTARYATTVAAALARGDARVTGVRSVGEAFDPRELAAWVGLEPRSCEPPTRS